MQSNHKWVLLAIGFALLVAISASPKPAVAQVHDPEIGLDFVAVDWGELTSGVSNVISGDFIFDNLPGVATRSSNGPTVINLSEGPVALAIRFPELVNFDHSGVIDRFGACFGKSASGLLCIGRSSEVDSFGIPVDAIPASTTVGFDSHPLRVLCPGELGKLDLIVHPGIPLTSGEYTGGPIELFARPVAGFGCDPVSSFAKLFAQEYLENMEKWELAFVAADALTLVSCLFPLPDPISKGVCIAGLLTTAVKASIDFWVDIVADPPDENFSQVVTIEPIPKVEPYDDSPLAAATAELATRLAQQNAILEALLITLERYQGATAAEEPTFILLQATALQNVLQLLIVNQQELHEALGMYESEFVVAINPNRDELTAQLAERATVGLTVEEREGLADAGLTAEDIQIIVGIFEALGLFLDEDFFDNLLVALNEWMAVIDGTILPALEQEIEELDALIASLTPVSVGGTTSFVTGGSGSSSGSIALLAGGVAVAVAIATAGGWYTRRRWLGSRS